MKSQTARPAMRAPPIRLPTAAPATWAPVIDEQCVVVVVEGGAGGARVDEVVGEVVGKLLDVDVRDVGTSTTVTVVLIVSFSVAMKATVIFLGMPGTLISVIV